MALSLVNVEAVRNAPVTTEPYHYFLGAGLLKDEAVPDLKRDFPAIDKPGYLTVDEVQLKGRFKTLIDELESPEFTEEISRKWGKDMHPYPRLTTIMKKSQPKYGSIHTDGPSKVMEVKNEALFQGRRDTSSTSALLGSSRATTLMLRGVEFGY